jgi:hypothetical protein
MGLWSVSNIVVYPGIRRQSVGSEFPVATLAEPDNNEIIQAERQHHISRMDLIPDALQMILGQIFILLSLLPS